MAVRDEDGRANFGDIMQRSSGEMPLSPWLRKKLQDTAWMQSHPYHRVVLTANGALQRTMSAWYQSEIKVEVIFNREIQEMISWAHPFVKQYDRRVQMSCCGEVFCVATSRIILSEQRAVDAVESGGVGIAQLFKHFRILPRFYLTDAGAQSCPGGVQLWRDYVLEGSGIECRIREDFSPNFLDLKPKQGYPEKDAAISRCRSNSRSNSISLEPHLGDLLKGTRCLNVLEDEIAKSASPLQRALLTAAGTVLRIITSYHKVAVTVGQVKSCPMPGVTKASYQRCVLMFCEGVAFCRARTLMTIESTEMKEQVDCGQCDLGELFRVYGLLPEFELQQVRLTAEGDAVPGFGRIYRLVAPGLSCLIAEEFAETALNLPGEQHGFPGIPLIWSEFPVAP